jgi:ADP-heptose:LPS heptosyltransferase
LASKLCVIHPGITGWGGRDWKQDRWAELTTRLMADGWNVLAVGKQELTRPLADTGISHLKKTSFTQLGAVIARAGLFIGIDSGPLHIAQAVGTKAIGLFGMSDPKFVLQQNSLTTAIYHPEAAPCCGIRHRVPGKTMIQCSTDCIKSITVDEVIEASKS